METACPLKLEPISPRLNSEEPCLKLPIPEQEPGLAQAKVHCETREPVKSF